MACCQQLNCCRSLHEPTVAGLNHIAHVADGVHGDATQEQLELLALQKGRRGPVLAVHFRDHEIVGAGAARESVQALVVFF